MDDRNSNSIASSKPYGAKLSLKTRDSYEKLNTDDIVSHGVGYNNSLAPSSGISNIGSGMGSGRNGAIRGGINYQKQALSILSRNGHGSRPGGIDSEYQNRIAGPIISTHSRVGNNRPASFF